MRKLILPLTERRGVAAGTMSFLFDLRDQDFTFRPGQYVRVTLSNPPYEDGEGNSRSFSIASSPGDSFLLIATRMRGSAFKRSLAEVPLGTPVAFNGPLGSFTPPQEAGTPLVLIAGGIGVTPFRSMIKHVTEQKLPHRLTLIYSNRTPQDAPFLEELSTWGRENPNLRFIPTMTNPEAATEGWRGRTGYVDVAFILDALPDLNETAFFLAGPPGMVEGITQALIQAGVAEDRIRSEEFTGY